jgi:hypothetical protein
MLISSGRIHGLENGDTMLSGSFSTIFPLLSFRFGFGVQKNENKVSVKLNGEYTYKSWKIPTWHERLKPAYTELQQYLKKYRKEKQ